METAIDFTMLYNRLSPRLNLVNRKRTYKQFEKEPIYNGIDFRSNTTIRSLLDKRFYIQVSLHELLAFYRMVINDTVAISFRRRVMMKQTKPDCVAGKHKGTIPVFSEESFLHDASTRFHIGKPERLFLIIPCYNEEENIDNTFHRLQALFADLCALNLISANSRLVFVDDGSTDSTFNRIAECAETAEGLVSCISLSNNKGHQTALLAGLDYARGKADITVSIDADLQQDPNAIRWFLEKYYGGYDVVYGVRNSRQSDSLTKRFSADLFYKLMQWLGCTIIPNHADYRLLSAKAVNTLMEYKEQNIFLRGLIPSMGYDSCIVLFDVNSRTAGTSKYTMAKMVQLATDGITSFSTKPLRMITIIGVVVCFFSIVLAVFYMIAFFTGKTVVGWTSLIIPILMLGGLQLFAIGCVGEYIGKTYMETKNRPRYRIKKAINPEDNTDE